MQTTIPPVATAAFKNRTFEVIEKPRNYTIDFFRAVGAFAVITLHMPYAGLPRSLADAILLSGRWAVPFFFMASGYFFQSGSQTNLDKEFLKVLKNLLNLFIITNAIYFFVALRTEFYSLSDILTLRTLLTGDYIHLWFIGALIFAYLLLWFVLSVNLAWGMPVVVLLGFLFCLITDPYSAVLPINMDGYLPRFLLSVPFLFLGFLYSKHQLADKTSIALPLLLIFCGIILQYLEPGFIRHLGTAPRASHEFFLGTFLLSIGLFSLALKIKMSKESILAMVGRKYSLLLYLYHPLIIVIIYYIIKQLNWQDKSYFFWFNSISVFIVTLIFIKLIEFFTPKIFKIISGKF